MVNAAFTDGGAAASLADAERRIVLAYAPQDRREGLAALLALDDALAGVLRTTRGPMIGQMRLTWWHDALASLDTEPPPAEPVLAGLAAAVLPHVPGASLTAIVEGWEELLDPEPLDADALARYAEGRGAGLFAAAATVLGGEASSAVLDAGRGWALADLAAHSTERQLRDMAAPAPIRGRWSRALRPLGAMAHLARLRDAGAAHRVGRILLHRLTGL